MRTKSKRLAQELAILEIGDHVVEAKELKSRKVSVPVLWLADYQRALAWRLGKDVEKLTVKDMQNFVAYHMSVELDELVNEWEQNRTE